MEFDFTNIMPENWIEVLCVHLIVHSILEKMGFSFKQIILTKVTIEIIIYLVVY